MVERRFRPESININELKPLIGIFYGNGVEPWMDFNIVLWFLPCLFVTEIVFYYIVQKITNKKYIVLTLIISSIIGFEISNYINLRLPWGINIVFTSIVFYGLGYILHKSNVENELIPLQQNILILIFLIINIPITFINKAVDMNSLILGNYFLYYIAAINGMSFLYLICKKIKKCNWLEFLGKNSLIIMCIHDPIKRIVIKVVSIISKIPTDVLRNSIIGSFICLVVLMPILILAIYIINNYLPFIIGRSKIQKDKLEANI